MWPIRGVGAFAAVMLASMVNPAPDRQPTPKTDRRRQPSPNDVGPVVDTTPESKRARRRRVAREQNGS
jgi:hypothetical protein